MLGPMVLQDQDKGRWCSDAFADDCCDFGGSEPSTAAWSKGPKTSRAKLACGAVSDVHHGGLFEGTVAENPDFEGDWDSGRHGQERSKDPKISRSKLARGADSDLQCTVCVQTFHADPLDLEGDFTSGGHGQEWSKDPEISRSKLVSGASSAFRCVGGHGIAIDPPDFEGDFTSRCRGQEWSKDSEISRSKLVSGAEPDKCFSAFLEGVAADNHDFSLDGGAADDGFGGGGQFFDRLAAQDHRLPCPCSP